MRAPEFPKQHIHIQPKSIPEPDPNPELYLTQDNTIEDNTQELKNILLEDPTKNITLADIIAGQDIVDTKPLLTGIMKPKVNIPATIAQTLGIRQIPATPSDMPVHPAPSPIPSSVCESYPPEPDEYMDNKKKKSGGIFSIFRRKGIPGMDEAIPIKQSEPIKPKPEKKFRIPLPSLLKLHRDAKDHHDEPALKERSVYTIIDRVIVMVALITGFSGSYIIYNQLPTHPMLVTGMILVCISTGVVTSIARW